MHQITITGPTRKNAWTPSAQLRESNLPWISEVNAFCGDIKRSMMVGEQFIDPDKKDLLEAVGISRFVFTSRRLALEAIDALKEKEKAKIAEFNAKYGCDYKYPGEKQ